MNLTALKTWVSGETLTATDLNGEFQNIYTHTITNSDIDSTGTYVLGELVVGSGITAADGGQFHVHTASAGSVQAHADANEAVLENSAASGLSILSGSSSDGNIFFGDAADNDVGKIAYSHSANSLAFTTNGATALTLSSAQAATFAGDVSVGGALTLTGGLTLNGAVVVGDSASDTLTVNATVTSDLLFTDSTYDIGKSGATRPRDGFFSRNMAVGGTLGVTGLITASGGVSGALTGNVTGNLTGDVTGDLTGNVTGNVTGNLTGDVTGNISGNVTGGTISGTTGLYTSTLATSAGDIGVGTHSPSGLGARTLNIKAASSAGADLTIEADNGNNFGVFFSGATASDPFSIFSNTGFKFATASDKNATGFDEHMRITSTGVGINCTPKDTLHVKIGTNLNWQFGYPNNSVTTLAALNDAESAYVTARIDAGTLELNGQSGGDVNLGAGVLVVDTSADRVGINTVSPTHTLDVNGTAQIERNGASPLLRFTDTSSSSRWIGIPDGSSRFAIYGTDGSTEEFVLSGGNVGIGTSSPSVPLHIQKSLVSDLAKFEDTGTDSNPNIQITNDARSYQLQTVGARSDNFEIWDRTAAATRLAITSAGNVLIGYTSSNGSYKLQVNSQIFATNATIATSDGRYKEDVQTLSNATDLVSRLNPVQFKWKAHEIHNLDVGKTDVGFIAQEVQAVLSDTDYSDSVVVTNKTDDEEYLGLGETKLIPLLTAALQEAITKIETLETKVAALEAA